MKKYKLNTNKKWKKDKLKINRSVKSSLTVCLVPHFSPFHRFLPPITPPAIYTLLYIAKEWYGIDKWISHLEKKKRKKNMQIVVVDNFKWRRVWCYNDFSTRISDKTLSGTICNDAWAACRIRASDAFEGSPSTSTPSHTPRTYTAAVRAGQTRLTVGCDESFPLWYPWFRSNRTRSSGWSRLQ